MGLVGEEGGKGGGWRGEGSGPDQPVRAAVALCPASVSRGSGGRHPRAPPNACDQRNANRGWIASGAPRRRGWGGEARDRGSRPVPGVASGSSASRCRCEWRAGAGRRVRAKRAPDGRHCSSARACYPFGIAGPFGTAGRAMPLRYGVDRGARRRERGSGPGMGAGSDGLPVSAGGPHREECTAVPFRTPPLHLASAEALPAVLSAPSSAPPTAGSACRTRGTWGRYRGTRPAGTARRCWRLPVREFPRREGEGLARQVGAPGSRPQERWRSISWAPCRSRPLRANPSASRAGDRNPSYFSRASRGNRAASASGEGSPLVQSARNPSRIS